MRGVQNSDLLKRSISYYKCHTKSETVKHFCEEGIHRSTIYKILKRYEKTGAEDYAKKPGRPRSKSTLAVMNKVKTLLKRYPSTSVRVGATKKKLTTTTYMRIKKKYLGFRAFSKKSVPKYIEGQEIRAKSGCRKVYNKIRTKIMIQDDETYVPVDPNNVPGRQFFQVRNPTEVDYMDKIAPKTKFFKK
jgi:transposase